MTYTEICPFPPPPDAWRAHQSLRALTPVSSADALRREVEGCSAFNHGNVLALSDDILLFRSGKRQAFHPRGDELARHVCRLVEQRAQHERELHRLRQQAVGQERQLEQRVLQQQQKLAWLERRQEQGTSLDVGAAPVQCKDDERAGHGDIIYTTLATLMLAIMAIIAGYGLEHYRSLKPYVAFIAFGIVTLLFASSRKLLPRK